MTATAMGHKAFNHCLIVDGAVPEEAKQVKDGERSEVCM